MMKLNYWSAKIPPSFNRGSRRETGVCRYEPGTHNMKSGKLAGVGHH